MTAQNQALEEMDVEAVKVDESLYPRSGWSNEIVNAYRTNLENLPPIAVQREEKILVDGYHRLLAHRLEGAKTIKVEYLDIPKDRILWEATRLNAAHGYQLSPEDKKRLARIFFETNGIAKTEIADVLAVSSATVTNWTRDLQEAKDAERDKTIIGLYLRCLTETEIADKVGLKQPRTHEIIDKFKTEFTDNPPESLQLFNVWYFPRRDPQYGLAFEGAIPGQIVENLLHYYTRPFDIVVDPMAGGGTTIDVCKAMYRRYRAYDLNRVRDDITPHDITTGYPKEAQNCDFIMLDPPYYNMVFEGLYANIDEFYKFIAELAKNSYAAIRKGGHVAFIIADMTEKGKYCLSGESYRSFIEAKFQYVDHLSCPMTTEQFNPQQVERAKTEHRMLGRNRDLYVFRRP